MTYVTRDRNWIIREGPDSLEHYKQVCQSNTIKGVKDWVRQRNGDIDFEQLLLAEERTKNRKGIMKWVGAIIDGRIDYQFDLLDWYDLVSILKSSLQKYIRRSKVEKAVRTAKRLFLMSERSATRRMKIIIVEDVGKATPLVGRIHEEMSLDKFLGVVKRVAETPKGSRAQNYMEVFKDLSSLDGREKEEELHGLIGELEGTEKKIAQVLKEVEIGEDEHRVYKIIDWNQVTESLITRVTQGTYFYGDKLLLVISAVLYSEETEQYIDVDEKPLVNPSAYSIMNFRELDWWCLDFHCTIGRVARNIFLSNHPSIDKDELETAWFQGESGLHVDSGEDASEKTPDIPLWNTYRMQIKELIEYVRKQVFNLPSFDEF